MVGFSSLRRSSVRGVEEEVEERNPVEHLTRINQGMDGSNGKQNFVGRIMEYITSAGGLVFSAITSMVSGFFGGKKDEDSVRVPTTPVRHEVPLRDDSLNSRPTRRFQRAYSSILAMDGPLRGSGPYPPTVGFTPVFSKDDRRGKVMRQVFAEWARQQLQEEIDRCERELGRKN